MIRGQVLEIKPPCRHLIQQRLPKSFKSSLSVRKTSSLSVPAQSSNLDIWEVLSAFLTWTHSFRRGQASDQPGVAVRDAI